VELLKPLCRVGQVERGKFMVRAPWDWVPGAEEMGVHEGEVPFVVEKVNEIDWVVDNSYGFSPDDPQGVDQEGFDEV